MNTRGILGILCVFFFLSAHAGRARDFQPNAPKGSRAHMKKIEKTLQKTQDILERAAFDPRHPAAGWRAPSWLSDAKFGVFVHFGPYAVPAFANEWYPRNMYQKDSPEYRHHVETYGPQTSFGYKDFFPLFKAQRFQADAWIELFRQAGARYLIVTAEHHDGFSLYDTPFSRWKATRIGPKRDILRELRNASEKKGLFFGVSYHRAEHWWFFNGGRAFPSDVQEERFSDLYGPARKENEDPDEIFLKEWFARAVDLVDRFHPSLLYLDWWVGERKVFKPWLDRLTAYFVHQAAKRNEEVALITKAKAFQRGSSAVEDVERGFRENLSRDLWQASTSISRKSWCYVKDDDLKDAGELLPVLLDTVSKNGVFLLNVGPKPDGTFSAEAVKILKDIGDWLAQNGEAVFSTEPWIFYGEGGAPPSRAGSFQEGNRTFQEGETRYTRKGDVLYACVLRPPKEPVVLTRLGTRTSPHLEIKNISLLGAPEEKDVLSWKRSSKALIVQDRSAHTRAARRLQRPVVYKIQAEGYSAGFPEVEKRPQGFSCVLRVQNFSKNPFSTTVSWLLNGKKEAERMFAVPPGGTKDLSFSQDGLKEGIFHVQASLPGHPSIAFAAALPLFPLSGEWRFHKGDDTAWKNPALSEKNWEKVHLPASWEEHSNYQTDHVFGWYRKNVIVPKSWEGRDLVLTLGKIDDADECFWNGRKIGRSGNFPPRFETAWNQPRRYLVPRNVVRFGEKNQIAVRVFDASGGGGILEGPLSIEPELTP